MIHFLGSQIQSFVWNAEENILAAIQDTRLVVWYCPTAAFSTTLQRLASFYYESSELGKSPRIADFNDDFVSIRRADGTLLNIMISPFPSILHKYCMSGIYYWLFCSIRTFVGTFKKINGWTLCICVGELTRAAYGFV